MSRQTGDEDGSIDNDLARLQQVYDDAAAKVEATPDPQQAFAIATRLTETLRQATIAAGQLRGRTLMRIWESEKMSLAMLAQRTGISKSRVDEMIRAARMSEGEQP